jgi:succinate dehydrogenase / fumarate reductase, cytochrome b subunit
MARPLQYLSYRGRGGHWSWILHRLTGLGVLFFLLIHILDISLIGWGPKVFDSLLIIYRGRVFRCMEVLLAGAVIYHALNGVRIIIVDFWPAATTVHRKLVYAVALIFVVIYVPTAVLMLNGLVK